MSAPSTSKSCPSCEALNDAGSRFCSRCGASLARPCPACGADLPPDAGFCPACGERLDSRPPLEERKFVTVLFADLVGSTKLGEALDAEKLKDVMDIYFKALREEIERFGGTVQKFIGDAVMATFGAPVAHEDDPERALSAARAMLRRLADVNRTLAGPYAVELAIRIGVNTGEVVAVSAPRADETMVADAVNVAARGSGLLGRRLHPAPACSSSSSMTS